LNPPYQNVKISLKLAPRAAKTTCASQNHYVPYSGYSGLVVPEAFAQPSAYPVAPVSLAVNLPADYQTKPAALSIAWDNNCCEQAQPHAGPFSKGIGKIPLQANPGVWRKIPPRRHA